MTLTTLILGVDNRTVLGTGLTVLGTVATSLERSANNRAADPPRMTRPATRATFAWVVLIRLRMVVVMEIVGTTVWTARAARVEDNAAGAAVTGICDKPAASAAAEIARPRCTSN